MSTSQSRWISHLLQAMLIGDGLVAGGPQIARMVEHRSSGEVSIVTWAWLFATAVLWVWQGRRDQSRVIALSGWVWAAASLAVLLTAIVFRMEARWNPGGLIADSSVGASR